MKLNQCIDCNKNISHNAIRCKSCAKKDKRNPMFGISRSGVNGIFYGKKHSLKTKEKQRKNKLGIKNPNYIDGRKNRKTYCIDCNKQISNFQHKRCKSCHGKYIWTLPGYKNEHSTNMKGKNNPMFGKLPKHGKWTLYKGTWMRSSWEVIYAKWLDHCKVKWQYECRTFDLGNTTYTPDFYLPNRDRYIEVKGYWRDDAKKKYKLFKKQYPNIKISLIIEPEIRRMVKDLK